MSKEYVYGTFYRSNDFYDKLVPFTKQSTYRLQSSYNANYKSISPLTELTSEDRTTIDNMIVNGKSDEEIINKISSLTISNSYTTVNTYSYTDISNYINNKDNYYSQIDCSNINSMRFWSNNIASKMGNPISYENEYIQHINTVQKYTDISMIRQYISYRRNFESNIKSVVYDYGSDATNKYIKEILNANEKVAPLQKPDNNSYDYEENSFKTKLTHSKRKVIRINDLYAYVTSYSSSGNMTLSKNIFSENTNPIKSVAIFCNERIPNSAVSDKYVKYFLIINNEEYEVEPINSERNGIKVIRSSEYNKIESYIKYITEDITSVSMRIEFTTTTNGQSPYLTDLKLLVTRGS